MEATLFISLIIVALTQIVKLVAPKVTGVATVVVAILAGVVVALLDTTIGVADITIAQGIVSALGAVGITTVASKVSSN